MERRRNDRSQYSDPGWFTLVSVLRRRHNSRGEIVGEAFEQSTGAAPGFVATACEQDHASQQSCEESAENPSVTNQNLGVSLPENVRKIASTSGPRAIWL
jgi:hypothetical protein